MMNWEAAAVMRLTWRWEGHWNINDMGDSLTASSMVLGVGWMANHSVWAWMNMRKRERARERGRMKWKLFVWCFGLIWCFECEWERERVIILVWGCHCLSHALNLQESIKPPFHWSMSPTLLINFFFLKS